YVTHHYGSWSWFQGYGWVWRPGHRWRGAWVAWASFGGHLGWAPCDHHGRAVLIGQGRRYDERVWSFSRPSAFVEVGHRNRGGRGFGVYTLPHDEIARQTVTDIAHPRTELAPPAMSKREAWTAAESPGHSVALHRLVHEEAKTLPPVARPEVREEARWRE